MKVFKHWAREEGDAPDDHGRVYRMNSWAGSNISLEEAREKALARLERWRRRLKQGDEPGEYYHETGEIREELISEQTDAQGELLTAITRNRYGALILNVRNVLFADVDVPELWRPAPGFFARLIGRLGGPDPTRAQQARREQARAECVQRFEQFHIDNPHLSFRVYETLAGYRLIVVSDHFNPLDAQSEKLLRELNSDELFIMLCRAQQCYRARLTPKPWRCGTRSMAVKYPRSVADEGRFAQWLSQYERASAKYAVCRLVSEFGNAPMTDTARTVVQMHDDYVFKPAANQLA